MKNKKSVVLYNLAIPLIALLILGGYVAIKNPKLVNQVKNKVLNMGEEQKIQEQKQEKLQKPDLEDAQKLEITEDQLNVLISTKMGDVDVGGNTIEDASVSIDGENNLITGQISVSNGLEMTFDAEPAADKLGVEIVDLSLVGDGQNTLFNLVKGPLKAALQKAVDKVIEEKAQNVEYLEIEDESIVIYLTNEN